MANSVLWGPGSGSGHKGFPEFVAYSSRIGSQCLTSLVGVETGRLPLVLVVSKCLFVDGKATISLWCDKRWLHTRLEEQAHSRCRTAAMLGG